MKKKVKIYLLVLVALMSSCKKNNIADVNKDFLGEWEWISAGASDKRILYIEEGKESTFQTCMVSYVNCTPAGSTCYLCEVNSKGTAKIKGDVLSIGINSFKIEQEPIMGSNGKLYIILDGDTYISTAGGTCNDGITNQNDRY